MATFNGTIWKRRSTVSPDADKSGRVVSWRMPSSESRGGWRWTFDLGLGAAGAAAALASAAFAFVMVKADITDPKFGGAEYLLLFTRPTQPVSVPGQLAAVRFEARGIDYTATGSIEPVKPKPTAEKSASPGQTANEPAPAAKPSATLKDYVLKTVRGGIAVVKGPDGDFLAEIGTMLPNGDLVISLDRRAGHWVVVTSSGLIQDQ